MNNFLQTDFIAIIIFLLMVIFLIMGGVILLLFKMLTSAKNQPSDLAPPLEKPTLRPVFDKTKIAEESIVEKYYCVHHKDSPSVGSCLICEEVYCADCLVDHESMHFCKEHFRTYANYKWTQITDTRTTPDTPEDGLYIYSFKRDIWLNRNIPSFVMTHYKINIENDYIESFIQLNVREEDVSKLTFELEKYKARD